jgi:membrane protease YdiL (CAAX protease family)
MEPENLPPQPQTPIAPIEVTALFNPDPEYRGLRWVFIGPQGLRAGWSAAIFFILCALFAITLGTVATTIARHIPHVKSSGFTPTTAIIGETILFFAMLAAVALVALMERRSIMDYNLSGPRPLVHFLSGIVAGFAALSALVSALVWGGWLHIGPPALSGAQIYGYAAIWGVVFLLTGIVEEGMFRGFLQFTLTRGINFWWALGTVGTACIILLFTATGNGVRGVYLAGLLGLFPCLILHIRKTPRSGFWQAAWTASTLFGFVHTGNGGENWIGIFAAALIGFVFCVSVRLTGSLWWAIGCHAAWDWAETFFYGTPDSGMVASGHYLTANATGNALWSGGSDGPEGSVLVLAVALLLLVLLLVIYGRKKSASPFAEEAAR